MGWGIFSVLNLHSLGAVLVVSSDAETSRKFIDVNPGRPLEAGLAQHSPSWGGIPSICSVARTILPLGPARADSTQIGYSPCPHIQNAALCSHQLSWHGISTSVPTLHKLCSALENILFHKVDHTSSIKRHSTRGRESFLDVLFGRACSR